MGIVFIPDQEGHICTKDRGGCVQEWEKIHQRACSRAIREPKSLEKSESFVKSNARVWRQLAWTGSKPRRSAGSQASRRVSRSWNKALTLRAAIPCRRALVARARTPASRNGRKVMHPGQLHCRLQFAILYEIYVYGILRPESSVIGSGRTLAYTVVEGSNTFEVFAVDSASNRSAPTSVAL